MLNPRKLNAGHTETVYGWEWVWVPSDGVKRSHWRASDDTGITIFPASDGIDEVRVCVPTGVQRSEEMVIHLEPNAEDVAFHYAGSKRKASAS